jgi:hypothetical protein
VTLSDGGGSFDLPADQVDDADADPTNEIQTISKVGQTVTLSDGGGSFTDAVDDADADPANEGLLTVLAGSNNSSIIRSNTNGNASQFSVVVGDGMGISEITGNTGAISLTVDDESPTNEIQTISLAGSTVTLSDGGGSFDLPADNNGIYGPSNSLTTNHVVTSNSNNLTFSMQGSDVFRIEGAGANYFSFDAAGDITANALGVFKGFGAGGVELGDTGENITLNAATGHSTIEADNDIVLDASNIRIIHDPVDDTRNTHVLAINATSRNLEEVPISHFGESTTASNGLTMNNSIVQLGGNLFQPTNIQIDNINEDYLLISSNQELFPAPGRQLRIHNSFVGNHSLGEWSSAGIELMAESEEPTDVNQQVYLRINTRVVDDATPDNRFLSLFDVTKGLLRISADTIDFDANGYINISNENAFRIIGGTTAQRPAGQKRGFVLEYLNLYHASLRRNSLERFGRSVYRYRLYDRLHLDKRNAYSRD